MLALALLMTALAGCGRKNSAEEPPAPVVTDAPAVTAAPAASAEPSAPPAVETPAQQTEPPAPVETAAPAAPAEPSAPPAVETPAQQTEPPAPAQPSGQNQDSAAWRFTGVQGTEFTVPEGFIQLDESPNIGYQYTFWHPDYEIRIVVYEIAPGYIPEGAYETDFSIAKRNPDVTYFNSGENWFVQSGYNNNGEEIFYSKERLTDSGLKTFWITYPTAKREFGDSITTEFEKNFSF